MNIYHEPVLLNEVVALFKGIAHLHSSVKVIDATMGFAGHTIELINLGYYVLGIESDSQTLIKTRDTISSLSPIKKNRVTIAHGNFSQITKIVNDHKYYPVSGILYDLGINSEQITNRERGISFSSPDAELDMRFDDNLGVKGKDLLNLLNEKQLIVLFQEICGKKVSISIARKVIQFRGEKNISSVGDFLKIVEQAHVGGGKTTNKATKPFMALRIAVNMELENLHESLPQAFEVLEKGGIIAVISFHSSEDRIVKRFMANKVSLSLAEYVGGEIIYPSKGEISRNPRSRSAKLRCIRKI